MAITLLIIIWKKTDNGCKNITPTFPNGYPNEISQPTLPNLRQVRENKPDKWDIASIKTK